MTSISQALRGVVWGRADSICEYCCMPQSLDRRTFEIDHIISRKHRGRTEGANLALACFPCNNHKGTNIVGIDPQTNQKTDLFNPRADIWTEHFQWNGPILIGRTPIGRATIEVLEINLPHRIAHRFELIQEGVFPPIAADSG